LGFDKFTTTRVLLKNAKADAQEVSGREHFPRRAPANFKIVLLEALALKFPDVTIAGFVPKRKQQLLPTKRKTNNTDFFPYVMFKQAPIIGLKRAFRDRFTSRSIVKLCIALPFVPKN